MAGVEGRGMNGGRVLSVAVANRLAHMHLISMVGPSVGDEDLIGSTRPISFNLWGLDMWLKGGRETIDTRWEGGYAQQPLRLATNLLATPVKVGATSSNTGVVGPWLTTGKTLQVTPIRAVTHGR